MKPVMIVLLAVAFAACNGNKTDNKKSAALDKAQRDTAHYTTVTWIDSLVNIGTLTMGDKREVKFRFKNTGAYPLIISNVAAGCGCTVPSYTKEPVQPGEEGLVTGAFDSNRAHPGAVRKNIMVVANTKPQQQFELVFTGEIKDVK